MESHNILRQDKGFTLIEIIIVLALIAMIAALGLFISFDFYRSYSFRSENNIVLSILQKARAQSLANIDQSNHGVHYGTGADCHTYAKCYVIFEGNNFVSGASTNLEIESSPSVQVTWSADPVFTQIDGTSNSVNITLTQGSKTSTLTTNNEGRIDWQ